MLGWGLSLSKQLIACAFLKEWTSANMGTCAKMGSFARPIASLEGKHRFAIGDHEVERMLSSASRSETEF